MNNRQLSFVAFLLACSLFMGVSPAAAQQTSGSISGVVQDSQGAVIPGAEVVLINQAQGATVRELISGDDGSFAFTSVVPGTYTVSVELTGFKKFIKQDIVLNTQGRVGLPPIMMEIGGLEETITVEANPVSLQTVSAERSGVIDKNQLVDLAVTGRNYTDLMKTVVGVVQDGWTGSVNGTRGNQNAYSVDGVSTLDTGCNCMWYSVNTDTLAEFKVLTNGQQAEFGRAAGANVSVVTKSGGRDFHGGAYWFMRNESLNANSWTNNRAGLPRDIYRYRTQGFTLGGPIFIPNKFNSDRQKLFFFVNMEWLRPRTPSAYTNLTLPTPAERQGDFSDTHYSDGSPVTIYDPETGLPFPNNQIPEDRWNPYGLEILNMFDTPNSIGVDPSFNHMFSFEGEQPSENQTVRIDYNISDKWHVYYRFVRNATDSVTSAGLNGDNNLGFKQFMRNRAKFHMANVTTLISPTMTNEFIYGHTTGGLPNFVPEDSMLLRANAGVTLPLLFPDADPTGVVPNLGFGSEIPNSPTIGFMGLPYDNHNPVVNITDNVSKVFKSHVFKAGFFIETARKRQTASMPNNGSLNFSLDPSNPGDTGWGFANLLLGNFTYFDQANTLPKGYYDYRNYEWYVQDTWKVNQNLSLDFGIRFSMIKPMYEAYDQISGFVPANYDPSQAVTLFVPALDPQSGDRIAQNPLTGEYAPATFIGSIVPGSGDVNNGMIEAGVNGVPRGLIEDRGVHYGPRFGLAWSPFGPNGKTVVRLGGGVFYERILGNMIFNQILYPPKHKIPRVYYGNLSTLAESSQTEFPVTAAGVGPDGKLPTVYNFNLSIQRELPFSLLLDVAYVGTQSRHLTSRYPYNEAPFGSAWLPENQDPTLGAPQFDGTTTLPVDFYRPYIGFAGYGTASGGNHPGGGGFITDFGGSSNYNSLQISLNRRAFSNLAMGLTYVWSRALGTQSDINEVQHPTDNRTANYGPLTFHRSHNFQFNYMYKLPRVLEGKSGAASILGRAILNGWEVSGITTFMTGAPANVSYSILGLSDQLRNRMITGSETQAPRVVMTGNPNLPRSERSIDAWIDTSVFQPASKGSQGMDSGRGVLTGPGTNNWDISIFRRIRLGSSEERHIQLRAEMYNAFNHTQFSGFNTTIYFDGNGNIANTAGNFGFGKLGAGSWVMRNPRRIQLAIKLNF
jgi:hypothetical protein